MPRYKSSPIERAAEQERKENLRNIKKKSFSAKLFVKGICTAYYIVLKLTVSAIPRVLTGFEMFCKDTRFFMLAIPFCNIDKFKIIPIFQV